MKKVLSVIALASFALIGCSQAETQGHAMPQKASIEAVRSVDATTPAGHNWEQNLDAYGAEVATEYLGQVCSYLSPLLSDGYFSDSDARKLSNLLVADLGNTNVTELGAIVVSAALKECNQFIEVLRK